MTEQHTLGRRRALQILAALGLGGLTGTLRAAEAGAIGALVPGRGWVSASDAACEGDGTPLQFIPRTAPDPDPLTDELTKYPKCPYCGMDRTEYHHSRHLVHYDDDLVDGTCSIHCLAISLALNLDRGPKAIYAADFGAEGGVKPLILVDNAVYLMGSALKGVMTANSKKAFVSEAAAKAAQDEHGGTLGGFDEALRQAYLGMAQDTMMIRRNRAERRKKMMEKT
ncbi:MAG: nitrous oxide reductase accessory protein NosL [Chromatiaceae bacterium]|jgi:nitrous oxide reductase accessory protein NosL|nr:nitrous oxide reductase accessory protein NosL [Chromatiaceae bacterium]